MSKIGASLALVAGATSGIGRATAAALAARGARVVLVGRREGLLTETAEEIRRAGGQADPVKADLTRPDEVESLRQRVERDLGAPDIVVNSAGSGVWRYLDETDGEALRSYLESPALAAMLVSRAFLPGMLTRGSGHIVHVTSVAGWFAWPGATAYTVARWAMRGLHEALAADLRGTRVRSTLATFAKVSSSYWEANEGSEERVPAAQALIRVLTPQQAAQAIVRGVQWNLEHVIAPIELRLMLLQARLFPGLTRWLLHATGYRRPPSLDRAPPRPHA